MSFVLLISKRWYCSNYPRCTIISLSFVSNIVHLLCVGYYQTCNNAIKRERQTFLLSKELYATMSSLMPNLSITGITDLATLSFPSLHNASISVVYVNKSGTTLWLFIWCKRGRVLNWLTHKCAYKSIKSDDVWRNIFQKHHEIQVESFIWFTLFA